MMQKNRSVIRCLKWMITLVLVIIFIFSGEARVVEAASKVISEISLGGKHSAALMEDGSLWLWGDNSKGQLGNGTTVNSSEPVKIMSGVKAVSLGLYFSGALKEDGSLWMWGDNSKGQLGNGTTDNSSTPVKIMDHVKAISYGFYHSAALKEDGSLWMWGDNGSGRLGNGTYTPSKVPVKIMDNVKAVGLGYENSAALKQDGSVWTWGLNCWGQMGDGTTASSNVPVKILEGVKAISVGYEHSAALKNDGSLWLWGLNSIGELGVGTTTDSHVPVKALDSVKAVSLGRQFSAAIKEDGSLWMWGTSTYGQLGTGKTNTNSKLPVKILDNVKAVASGNFHTAALRADGSLWMWGDNSAGQLGNGTTVNSNLPVKNTNFKASLSGASLSLTSSHYTYDGSAKTPGVTVTLHSAVLTPGTDYSVSYSNNIYPGTAAAVITGMGEYGGTVTKSFFIDKASLKTAVLSLAQSSYSYDGQAKTPSVTAKLGSRILVSGTDYTVSYSNNINAGTATVTAVGKGNYTDTVSKTFTIKAAASQPSETQPASPSENVKQDISGAVLKLSQTAYTYNMEEYTPSVTLTLGGITLKANRDYIVTYANNMNAGTATATAIGMGNYTGKKSGTFTILKAEQKFSDINNSYTLTEGDSMSLASARVSATLSGSVKMYSEAAKVYKSSDASVVSVDKNGLIKALKEGSASITITDPGTSNLYAVTFTLTIKVEKAGASGGSSSGTSSKTHISSSTITLKKNAYTYTGKAIKPEVTITGNGRTLKAGTDYTVSYLNNVKAGQAIVRIAGEGAYTGQTDKTFTIKKKAQKITAKNITLVRSSKKQTKKLSVKVLGGAKVTYTPSNKKFKISKGKVTIPAGFTGLCKIKIKAASTQNYKSGSKTIKIIVNPPATILTGLFKDVSQKAFMLRWKTVRGVTGYEAQMALDGNFKKSVKKVKGTAANARFYYTSGKTYHFRVRTYKKVSGKLYYSKWSKTEHQNAD